MLQTLSNSPSRKKIQLHSPFLHARLPQMLPKVQYAYKTKPNVSFTSPQMGQETKLESPSLTLANLQTVNSMTQTKRMLKPPSQRFHVLVPLFNHLAKYTWRFPSWMTKKPTTLLSLPTRVQNTIHHNEEYIANIEEVIRIAQVLRHQGMPSEDDKAAALVAQLNKIQLRESEPTTHTPSPNWLPHPTPPVHCNLQVTVSIMASCTKVHTVASRLTLPQQPCPQGQ